MSIEFNCHLPMGSTLTLSPGMGWDLFDVMYGASAGNVIVMYSTVKQVGAIKLMANAAGYEVVHVITGFDMYLVRRDLLMGECPPSFANYGLKTDFLHFCVKNPDRRGRWMEYTTYKRTGDVGLAQQAAVEQMLMMRHPLDGGPSSMRCLGIV